jgi:hypothetical protein
MRLKVHLHEPFYDLIHSSDAGYGIFEGYS